MRLKKIWINKAKDFKSAEEFDIAYYRQMTPIERIETMQILREIFFKLKPGKRNEGRKRLRRVVKIIQQA